LLLILEVDLFYVSIGSNDEGVIYYDLVGLGDDEPLRKMLIVLENL
jgi:hypothetical protein